MKRALMSTQKKLCTARKLTKVTFSHDKISMSMSSTDKYIPGMFCRLTYVDVRIRSTRSRRILNVFWFYKYIFLQSIARKARILYILRGQIQKCGGGDIFAHSKLCNLDSRLDTFKPQISIHILSCGFFTGVKLRMTVSEQVKL